MRLQKPAVYTLRQDYLRFLLAIRGLVILCQSVGLLVAWQVLDYPVPIVPVALIVTLLAGFTLYSWRSLRAAPAVSEHRLLGQLAVDVLALTLLFYFSGGSANPLVSLFLLPVTVAAAILKPRYGGLIAGAAIASYTLLMFFNKSLTQGHIGHHDINLHLWGMWLGFVVSAALVAYFVARIGRTLRLHDEALNEAREEAIRSDQMVALGTLAAGTAHDLGTPLATMAVLTTEVIEAHDDDPELTRQLSILRGQIDRCKEILSRMSADAGQARADSGRSILIDRYLHDLLDQWQLSRPEIELRRHSSGDDPAPWIVVDESVSQAIRNLLDNAAQASPQAVKVRTHWSEHLLTIEVRDWGPGLDHGLRERLGKLPLPVDSAKSGMGIGLFLSQSIIERLGGKLTLTDAHDGGLLAAIQLPLDGMRAKA